ncbi:MAG TPA: hypothetical protein VJN02_03235 [Gammaproteobacteria bacterium]|nr:hypothetical protein [Gammaproteobacteria bacterium]
MLRKNFPGRVKIRRRGALERLARIGSTGCGEVNANTVRILRRRLDERKTLEDRINTNAPARLRRRYIVESPQEGTGEE